MKIFTLAVLFLALAFGMDGQKFTRSLSQEWKDSGWHDDSRATLTYQNGLAVTILDEDWDDTNFWEKGSFTTISYNSDKTISQYVDQEWDKVNSKWENSFMGEFFYSNGKVSSILSKSWKNSVWENESLINYNYTSGFLVSEEYKTWDLVTSEWENGSLSTYTNRPDGLASTKVTQNWDDDTGWENGSKEIYSYTGSNRTQVVYQMWMGDYWSDYQRETITYNQRGDVVTSRIETFDFLTSGLMNSYLSTNTYNSSGDITEELGQEWNSTTSQWDNDNRTIYYYDSSTGIDGVLPPAVRMFPNPTYGIINVEIGNFNSLGKYSVSDLTGRVRKTGYIVSNSSEIDLTYLRPGVYVVKVNLGGSDIVMKFIKK
jgi:hypothetical protein